MSDLTTINENIQRIESESVYKHNWKLLTQTLSDRKEELSKMESLEHECNRDLKIEFTIYNKILKLMGSLSNKGY